MKAKLSCIFKLLTSATLLGAILGVSSPCRASDSLTDWLDPVNDGKSDVIQTEKDSDEPLPNLVDNDVYLLTPKLYQLVQRFADGEVFDMDEELERMIARRPSHFPLYYFAGMLKVRRLLLAPDDKRDDERIEELFAACIDKAGRAAKLPEFRHSGLFYSTVCEAGQGLFEGLRGRYLAAKERGPRLMRQIDKLLDERPHLHGALLLKGMYHFYTGRFGPLVNIILALVGMPQGNVDLGLRLIDEAVSTPSPVQYFTRVYAIYAFNPSYKTRAKALKIADELVRDNPKNYYSYFMRGGVYENKRDFRRAYADTLQARTLLPGAPERYRDIVHRADMFLIDARLAYLEVMLHSKKAGLRFLESWAAKKAGDYDYADAPLVACLQLGHLYSFAGKDETALKYYRKMQDFPEAQWMKDIGRSYERLPIGKRFKLDAKTRQRLTRTLDASSGR